MLYLSSAFFAENIKTYRLEKENGQGNFVGVDARIDPPSNKNGNIYPKPKPPTVGANTVRPWPPLLEEVPVRAEESLVPLKRRMGMEIP